MLKNTLFSCILELLPSRICDFCVTQNMHFPPPPPPPPPPAHDPWHVAGPGGMRVALTITNGINEVEIMMTMLYKGCTPSKRRLCDNMMSISIQKNCASASLTVQSSRQNNHRQKRHAPAAAANSARTVAITIYGSTAATPACNAATSPILTPVE